MDASQLPHLQESIFKSEAFLILFFNQCKPNHLRISKAEVCDIEKDRQSIINIYNLIDDLYNTNLDLNEVLSRVQILKNK